MAKLNMVLKNTLFRKGYLLLAGVMMAANMFVVNEVKASAEDNHLISLSDKIMIPTDNEINNDNNIKKNNETEVNDKKKEEEKKEGGDHKKKQGPLDILLSCENYFNLFGTLALSGANNYFKLWDYNPGWYRQFGCLGWRTKKFFDIVQLDFNLNLGRGAFWAIPHIIKLIMIKTKAKKENTEENKPEKENEIKSVSNTSPWVSFLFKDILRGFVSIPLTLHISNFSISISIDSILWEFVIGRFFDEDKKGGKKNDNEGEVKLDSNVPIEEKINNENPGTTS